MASWDRLRVRLEAVDDRVTLSWSELEALVGGLPPSAFNHRAFWGGDRRQWAGFRTTNVRVGEQVTFHRVGQPEARRTQPSEPLAAPILVSVAQSKGFDRLAVFGSVARGEARVDSDIDLLVEAPAGAGIKELVELQGIFQEILGRPVDLVTYGGLKPTIDADIHEEAVLL